MSRLRLVLLLTLACTSAAPLQKPTQDPAPLQPPIARKEPKDVSVHGDKRIDDYFWLRNKGTPEVEQYLLAETAYADAVMAPTAQLQKTLYEEMLSRIQETDQQVPFLRDGHYYYSRTEKGKQYPILCRRKGSPAAPEQVILDLNLLAEGKKFLGLGGWTPSDDGSLLAYSTDETGFRQFDLHVKDLSSGKTGPERIERVDSFAWGRDGKSLFYVTEDAQTKRANQLWRHILGTSRRAGRALAQQGLHLRHLCQPHGDRGALLRRERSLRQPPRRAAAREGPRVLPRSPRRPLLHPHQLRRAEFPPGDRAGIRPAQGELDGAGPAP